MITEQWVRGTLWLSFPFNLIAAYGLFLPASFVGQLIGLPTEVPLAYAALLSYMVLVFGFVYAWLATNAVINKPLLFVGCVGKGGVFLITGVLCLLGAAPGAAVLVASGDLAFATIWGLWLWNTRQS